MPRTNIALVSTNVWAYLQLTFRASKVWDAAASKVWDAAVSKVWDAAASKVWDAAASKTPQSSSPMMPSGSDASTHGRIAKHLAVSAGFHSTKPPPSPSTPAPRPPAPLLPLLPLMPLPFASCHPAAVARASGVRRTCSVDWEMQMGLCDVEGAEEEVEIGWRG
ncbi:unnamed protein product [Closterium sp. NIES-54]